MSLTNLSKVIDAIGNSAEPTENGMQAMAVAPVDVNGNVDYSEVVIAYAGTNFGDMPDLQNLGLGSSAVAVLPNMSSIGQLLQGMSTLYQLIERNYESALRDLQQQLSPRLEMTVRRR